MMIELLYGVIVLLTTIILQFIAPPNLSYPNKTGQRSLLACLFYLCRSEAFASINDSLAPSGNITFHMKHLCIDVASHNHH